MKDCTPAPFLRTGVQPLSDLVKTDDNILVETRKANGGFLPLPLSPPLHFMERGFILKGTKGGEV